MTRRAVLPFLTGVAWAQPTKQSVSTADVTGAWILDTVAGSAPDSINVKRWRINLAANGQWTYSVEMNEKYSGKRLDGSGSWKIVSGESEYTADGIKVKSRLMIRDGKLTLSPDPVVAMPGGHPAVMTTYKRLPQ